MNGQDFRSTRQRMRLSQTEIKAFLNQRLGRSYDKPKISRWENGREPVPEDVATEISRMAELQPRDAQAIVLANQKGGVGKTTSALNLAYALHVLGQRVLLVDMDPQATATVALLSDGAVEAYRQARTVADVILRGKLVADTIIKAGDTIGGCAGAPFDLLASHIDLSETDGRREPGFDTALREALDEVRSLYDYIIIDAPPNLGMLTWMALAAGQDVIIPVRTEPYDTMGVGLILATINKVQRRLNPALRLAGILPTQYGKRKSVDREVLTLLATAMGGKTPVLEPVPESAVFGHAARAGRIAIEASPANSAVTPYRRLAAAIVSGSAMPTVDLEMQLVGGM